MSSFVAKGVEKQRNIFEDSSPGLDVLDQRSPVQQEANQTTEADVGNAFTSLFGSESKPEKKEEEAEIIPYD